MMRLLGQMIKLPIAAFVYGMEILVKAMKDIQKTADQSVDTMVNGIAQGFSGAPDCQSDLTIDAIVSEVDRAADHTPGSQGSLTHGARASGIVADDAKATLKEERKMADTNLSDDRLKLVRYKILFVKRDYEHAFSEVEELVSDNLTPTAYTAWKIAEFIQTLARGTTDVPKKWTDGYPKDYRKDGKLIGFPEDDKKYLRVYYEVLDRYVREPFKYEEEQIDVLKEIRDKLGNIKAYKDEPGASSGGGTASGGTAGGGRGTGAM
jgi:hypothetical protein